jgi:hypothetical protein
MQMMMMSQMMSQQMAAQQMQAVQMAAMVQGVQAGQNGHNTQQKSKIRGRKSPKISIKSTQVIINLLDSELIQH